MLVLRTVIFFIGWTIFTLIVGVVGIPTMLHHKWCQKLSSGWAGLTLWWIRVACGVRTQYEGTEHVEGAKIVASKHQSAWDTMALQWHLPAPVFVLKRELYWVPIFGWYLARCGQIAINRSAGEEAFAQVQRQAPKYIAEGRPVVMFPEGTRVRIGDHKRYRTGVARLSEALQLPVVPAALNAGLFWPKTSLVKKPGTATMKFLPAIQPPGEDRAEWMVQLEQVIEGETHALVEAARK
jgi:1-acyl-sn-glycerol-3-phosphate acyltransferase